MYKIHAVFAMVISGVDLVVIIGLDINIKKLILFLQSVFILIATYDFESNSNSSVGNVSVDSTNQINYIP